MRRFSPGATSAITISQIRTGDMRLFLTEDLGSFDVVTAFCSLYYLPEAGHGAR